MEKTPPEPPRAPESVPLRPFILSLICLFSFTFFGLISLIFLFALLYSGSIATMILRYAPENSVTRTGVFFYLTAGFLLHALSFTGIIFIWNLRKKGFVLFGITTLTIAIYQVFSARISPLTTAVYVFLILATGAFIKKLR